MDISHLFQPHMLDLVIMILSFAVGRISGGLGLFFSMALILLRLARIITTHPNFIDRMKKTNLDEKVAVLHNKYIAEETMCLGKGEDEDEYRAG